MTYIIISPLTCPQTLYIFILFISFFMCYTVKPFNFASKIIREFANKVYMRTFNFAIFFFKYAKFAKLKGPRKLRVLQYILLCAQFFFGKKCTVHFKPINLSESESESDYCKLGFIRYQCFAHQIWMMEIVLL